MKYTVELYEIGDKVTVTAADGSQVTGRIVDHHHISAAAKDVGHVVKFDAPVTVKDGPTDHTYHSDVFPASQIAAA